MLLTGKSFIRALLKPLDFHTTMFKQYCNPEENPAASGGFAFKRFDKPEMDVPAFSFLSAAIILSTKLFFLFLMLRLKA